MEKNKIVLLHIYYKESGYGKKLHYPPLGIAYISEYLEKKNIKHYIIDQGLGYSATQILKKLKKLNPNWIGISINSLSLNKTNELIKKIKSKIGQVKIVVGGPHVTTQGIRIFSELPSINYAIVGEGEKSFFNLITNKDKSKIKGLIYKNDDGFIKSNERRITKDINELPFPKFKRFELDKYQKKIIPIISSRGCPFKCIFCQQSSLLSKNWRGISAENFIKILKYWQNKSYKEIHILDDNFAFDLKRLDRIVELYKKENLNKIKIDIVGGIRVSSNIKDTLLLFQRLGVDYISFGIESFSDKVLNFIKKGTTEKQIEETIKIATEMKFKVRLFFIIGLPYQTIESLRNSYKLIFKYPIYQVRFFNLIPYEHTKLMEWLDENGKLIYPPSEYMNHFKKFQKIPVFEAKHTMSFEERTRQLKIAQKVVRLINKRSKSIFAESD